MIRSRYEVPSVRAGARILRGIAAANNPLGVSELSRSLSIPKATVFRIVSTLEAEGFIERAEGDRFRIGRVAFEVGSSYSAQADLESAFRGVAQKLVSQHNETVQLAILVGTDVLYVGKEDSSQPVRLVSRLGARLPAHVTALGKALLSCLSEEDLRHLYPTEPLPQSTPNSHQTLVSLLADLRQIRERGWAHDDQEATDGLHCVASPIFDQHGRSIAAISISAPSHRIPASGVAQLGEAVRGASSEISSLMGHHPGIQR